MCFVITDGGNAVCSYRRLLTVLFCVIINTPEPSKSMKTDFDSPYQGDPARAIYKTKATISAHIAIFEPEAFAVGEVFCVGDYHFLLFLSSAPVTRVGNAEFKVKKGDMLVIQPWEEVYGIPCDAKTRGKYLHIAVKKEFFADITSEISRGELFKFKHVHGHYSSSMFRKV